MLFEDFDEIPDNMRNARRWILWKFVQNKDPEKKPRKVPYYTNGIPRNGALDTDTDKSGMDALVGAVSAFNMSSNAYAGVGFALGDGWQGVDIDGIDKHPELEFIIEDIPSYVEKSPSGNGYHAIGFGRDFEAMGSNESGIEAYCKGRFFTVTGDSVSGIDIHDISDYTNTVLRPLHNKHSGKNSTSNDNYTGEVINLDKKTISSLRSALNVFSADDRDTWVKFGQCLVGLGDIGRGLFMDWSEQSEKFDPLGDAKTWESFSGDRSGYKGIFKAAWDKGWDGGAKETILSVVDKNGNTIDSAQDDNDDSSPKFRTVSFKDVLERKTTSDWLIKDWIEPHSLVQIFGASSSGKSFFALDMAYCISCGVDFFGNATMKGNVLYIAGEGFSGLTRRSRALQDKYASEVGVFEYSEQPAQILSEENCESINELITSQDGGFDVIFIDTLNRNMGVGDENSTKDMTQFVTNIDRYLRSTGSAVIWVHHTGLMDKTRARGSSSVYGALSTELRVEKDDNHDMTITCTKQKEADDGWTKDFKLKTVSVGIDDEGEDITSCVVVSDDTVAYDKAFEETGSLKDKEQAVYDALREEGINNGVDETIDGVLAYTVTDKLWRDNAFKRIDGNNKRRDYGKYKKTLIDKGLVFQYGNDYYVKNS